MQLCFSLKVNADSDYEWFYVLEQTFMRSFPNI
jgi:hypothetical protein